MRNHINAQDETQELKKLRKTHEMNLTPQRQQHAGVTPTTDNGSNSAHAVGLEGAVGGAEGKRGEPLQDCGAIWLCELIWKIQWGWEGGGVGDVGDVGDAGQNEG